MSVRSERVELRLTPEEKARWLERAGPVGLSKWIRSLVLRDLLADGAWVPERDADGGLARFTPSASRSGTHVPDEAAGLSERELGSPSGPTAELVPARSESLEAAIDVAPAPVVPARKVHPKIRKVELASSGLCEHRLPLAAFCPRCGR